MEQYGGPDELLDYLSAEDSLSSASLEDKESHMGLVDPDENLHPLVGSVEPEELEPQEKEVITGIVATVQRNADVVLCPMGLAEGSKRQNPPRADKPHKKIIADECHPMSHSATSDKHDTETPEHDTETPSSSASITYIPREEPHCLHFSGENMDSSGSSHGLYRPADSEGVAAEVDFQPIMDINSLSETSKVSISWDYFSEVPISDAFSTTIYSPSGVNSSDVPEFLRGIADTFQLPAAEGETTVVTSQNESDEENESHTYHRGGTGANWEFADWELEDGINGLPLEGDLDYLSEEREEMGKVSEYSFFSWPAALLTQTIDFQIKIIMFGVSIVMWFFNLFVMEPINLIFWARDTVVAGINNVFSLISSIFQFLGHLREQVASMLKKAAKKLSIGVLTATYVTVVLSSLLIPAVLLDFLFVASFVEDPIQIREQLYFDYTQQSPSAAVSLFPANVMHKMRAPAFVYPEKVVNKRLIPLNHKLSVTVILKMPESEHNLHIGMFQVSAELISLKGQLIARFTHPCMLHFHSWPIRYVKTVLMAMPLMLGLYSESQVVVLRLIESYDDNMNPTASIKILLESRAGYLPGAGLPEVYSADAVIQSELPWVKSVVYQWKWTFFVWSGLGLFLFEVALLLCCCRQLLIPWVSTHDHSRVEYRGGEETRKALTIVEADLVNQGQSQGERRVPFQEDMATASVVPEPGSSMNDTDNFVAKELEALTSTKANLEMLQRVTRFWE